MDAAKRLRELRLSKNLTTTELAARCDMQQSTISKLENNKRVIDVPTLELLCRELDVTLSEFFYYEPIPIHLYNLMIACKALTPEQVDKVTDAINALRENK